MPTRYEQVGNFGVALRSQKVVKRHQDGPRLLFRMGQVCIERLYVDLAIVARDRGKVLLPNGPVNP